MPSWGPEGRATVSVLFYLYVPSSLLYHQRVSMLEGIERGLPRPVVARPDDGYLGHFYKGTFPGSEPRSSDPATGSLGPSPECFSGLCLATTLSPVNLSFSLRGQLSKPAVRTSPGLLHSVSTCQFPGHRLPQTPHPSQEPVSAPALFHFTQGRILSLGG